MARLLDGWMVGQLIRKMNGWKDGWQIDIILKMLIGRKVDKIDALQAVG